MVKKNEKIALLKLELSEERKKNRDLQAKFEKAQKEIEKHKSPPDINKKLRCPNRNCRKSNIRYSAWERLYRCDNDDCFLNAFRVSSSNMPDGILSNLSKGYSVPCEDFENEICDESSSGDEL